MQSKKAINLRRILSGIIVVIFLLPYATVSANDCTWKWFRIPHEIDKDEQESIVNWNRGYPEWNGIYWSFSFHKWPQIPERKELIKKLTIKGEFPYARYMSLILYDITTGNPVGQLLDSDIQPDENSVNPYIHNTSRAEFDNYGNPIDRNYTVNLVKEEDLDQDTSSNTLVIPIDVTDLVLMLRIYLPDADKEYLYRAENNKKLTPPIKMTASSNLSGELEACPGPSQESYAKGMEVPDGPQPDQLSEGEIWSFRPGPVGLYPNGDNPYLAAPMLEAPNGNIAVMQFLAPKYTKTRNSTNMFTGDEQVRYWSVCLCDLADTSTSEHCFADEDMIVDDDGYVKIAVADQSFIESVKQNKENIDNPLSKWNYIPWADQERPVLIYRHLVPMDKEKFAGSFQRVENPYESDSGKEALADGNYGLFAAHNNIGEYGLRGIYCSESDFEDSACGGGGPDWTNWANWPDY